MLVLEIPQNGWFQLFSFFVSACSSYLERVTISFPRIVQKPNTILRPSQVPWRNFFIHPSATPQIEGENQVTTRVHNSCSRYNFKGVTRGVAIQTGPKPLDLITHSTLTPLLAYR